VGSPGKKETRQTRGDLERKCIGRWQVVEERGNSNRELENLKKNWECQLTRFSERSSNCSKGMKGEVLEIKKLNPG